MIKIFGPRDKMVSWYEGKICVPWSEGTKVVLLDKDGYLKSCFLMYVYRNILLYSEMRVNK